MAVSGCEEMTLGHYAVVQLVENCVCVWLGLVHGSDQTEASMLRVYLTECTPARHLKRGRSSVCPAGRPTGR